MSESLVSEWLDENRFRAFPLKEDTQRVSGAYTLPDDVILDAYFNIYTDVAVELTAIVATTDDVTFQTSEEDFVVERPISGDVTVTNASGNKITFGVAVNDIPNGTYTFTDVYFEDALCVYYNPAWLGVNQVEFDNGVASPVTGNINILPKEQTYLGTKGEDVLIWTIGRNVGTPVDNCVVYGDLPDDCGSQISFINGVPSNNTTKQFKLTTGSGIKATSDPDNHQIVLSLTFDVENICPAIPPTT